MPLTLLFAVFCIRLSAIAAGLYMHDSACGREEKRPVVWKYSGIMGMLVGGEILTTIGAILFLYVLPGWEAVFSLLMSLFALLVSTRTNMIRVQNTALHQCPAAEDDPDSGRCVPSAKAYFIVLYCARMKANIGELILLRPPFRLIRRPVPKVYSSSSYGFMYHQWFNRLLFFPPFGGVKCVPL